MKMDEDGWISIIIQLFWFSMVFTSKVLTDCHRPVSTCGGNSSVTLLSVGSIQHFAGETFIFDCWKPYVCDLNPVLLVSSFFSAGQNYSKRPIFSWPNTNLGHLWPLTPGIFSHGQAVILGSVVSKASVPVMHVTWQMGMVFSHTALGFFSERPHFMRGIRTWPWGTLNMVTKH